MITRYFSLRHMEEKLIIIALLNADNFSDQRHIPGIQDKGYNFSLTEQDAYWKQDQGLRVLHWLPSNFTSLGTHVPVLHRVSVFYFMITQLNKWISQKDTIEELADMRTFCDLVSQAHGKEEDWLPLHEEWQVQTNLSPIGDLPSRTREHRTKWSEEFSCHKTGNMYF